MPRLCKNCNKELVKHAHESNKRYAGKQYCSSLCSRIGLKAEKRGWWQAKTTEPNAEVEHGRREYLKLRGEM